MRCQLDASLREIGDWKKSPTDSLPTWYYEIFSLVTCLLLNDLIPLQEWN